MKQFACIVFIFVMVALMVSPTSAYTDFSQYTTYNFGVTFPLTMGPVSSAEADQICIDMGYTGGHYGTTWREDVYSTAMVNLDGDAVSWGSTKVTTTAGNELFGVESFRCIGASSNVAAKTYYFKPLFSEYPFNVTVDKTSGFSPLTVIFTPNDQFRYPQAAVQTWDFGDGNITTYGTNSIPTTINHVYQSRGNYTVSVSNLIRSANYRNYSLSILVLDDEDTTFNGTPTTGSSPLSVSFVASNITNTTGISWSFGDGNISASGLPSVNHLYQNQGIYTVRMDYTNLSGIAKSIQKNNYITVGAPNATKTKYFQTIDGTNGNIVLNSSIQLKDVENVSWVNATELTDDGTSSITTLVGHTIDAYAQALGYSDSDDLGIVNDGMPQYIMMWPTFAKNVSAGNVSVYVTVKDKDSRANIVGAQVTMSPSVGAAQSTTTNEAGIAYFIVTNNTMALITASAIGQGYQTSTTTINTGTGSGGSASAATTILLSKSLVTPTYPTVTTLPDGSTPTPTTTILPGCEDTISAEGQAKCRAAQSNQGLSFLADNMMTLIELCVFVTMLYLLGIKLGK